MSETQNQKVWKSCSTCKKPIAAGDKYFVCSVSTCTSQRTGYQFCSINCFEAHLPGARHRDAGAIEKVAPRVIMANQTPQTGSTSIATKSNPHKPPEEVLIVASRLKEYIQAVADYSTSASVMDILSEHVRWACQKAIENARADGRRTVMDRDFYFLEK